MASEPRKEASPEKAKEFCLIGAARGKLYPRIEACHAISRDDSLSSTIVLGLAPGWNHEAELPGGRPRSE